MNNERTDTYVWDYGYQRPTEEERKYTFVCSCIESVALRLNCKASAIFRRMNNVGLIDGYIWHGSPE